MFLVSESMELSSESSSDLSVDDESGSLSEGDGLRPFFLFVPRGFLLAEFPWSFPSELSDGLSSSSLDGGDRFPLFLLPVFLVLVLSPSWVPCVKSK